MHFTRLRLSGFKSFGEPAEMEIAPGLTGVVGPNGCGKSNIVEALRWVMGESSAKGLRGAEMEEVIFGGTAKRPQFDLAEVALSLKRPVTSGPSLTAGRAPLKVVKPAKAAAEASPDGSGDEEVEIVRRIARGSGSAYKVNGREARARDVQLLFADAGSGARSPAIVSQGKVSFVVDAKPEERRRLLEDAAGVGGLHGRRREAELKLAATLANLERVGDQLATFEEQAKSLERQAGQAERYRVIQAEARRTEALLLLARVERAGEALEAAQAASDAAEQRRAAQDQAASTARTRADGAAGALPDLRERAGDLARRLVLLDERLRARAEASAREERERALVAEQTERAQTRTEELRAAIAGDEARLRDGRADHEALAIEAAGLRAAVARTRGELEALEAKQAEAKAALDAALADAGQARQAVALLDARGGERRSRLGQAERELQRLGEVDDAVLVEVAARKVGEAQSALEGLRAEAERADAARDELAARGAGLQAQLDEAKAAEAAALASIERRAAEAETLQAQADAQAQRRAWLERAGAELDARAESLTARREALGAAPADDPAALTERAGAMTADADEAAAGLAVLEHRAAELARTVANLDKDLTALEREQDRAEAERSALLSVQAAAPCAEPLLDRLGVPDGLTAALTAALGDDLLAGTDVSEARHWLAVRGDDGDDGAKPPPGVTADGNARADLPPGELPAGAVPLSRWVEAPRWLRPRLDATGLVADAVIAAKLQHDLKPGQRLVTAAGGCWRWDGLVRAEHDEGAGQGASTRAEARRRLDELQRLLDDTGERLAEALDAKADAQARLDALLPDVDALRERRAACAEGAASLEAKAEAVRAEAERFAQASAALDAEAARLGEEQARHAESVAALQAEGPAPDPAEARHRKAEAEEARADAAARVKGLSRSLAKLAEDAQTAERQVRVLHGRVEAARQALEGAKVNRERRAAEAEARALHRAQAKEGLEAERARLIDELAALDQERAAASAALEAAKLSREAAEAELTGLNAWTKEAAGESRRAEGQEQALVLRAQAWEAERGRLEAGLERAAADLSRATADSERYAAMRAALDAAAAKTAGDEGEGLQVERDRVAFELEAANAALAEAERLAADTAKEAGSTAIEASKAGEAAIMAAAKAEQAREALDARQAQARDRLNQNPALMKAGQELAGQAKDADEHELAAELDRLKAKRERLGAVNLRAVIELEEVQAKFDALKTEADELNESVERLKSAIHTLNKEARERILEVFAQVQQHFEHLFTRLFGGGKAQLRLTNPDDPLESGLDLDAMPPGKKLQNIRLMSGGEKSMTAIALVFAFFLAQPSPLCVLDEVDAALDDANVERFVSLMTEIARRTDTRFLCVTHHPLTMARMDRLFGVTMVEKGVSTLVSVALDQAVELRATA